MKRYKWNIKNPLSNTNGVYNLDYIFSKERDLGLNYKASKDVFQLKDMRKAVDLLKFHIDKKSKIVILGDYDCDGVCSTFIISDFINKNFENEVEYIIPDRHKDGYGMKMSHVDKIISGNFGLVITVDNGIVAFDEIQALRDHEIDVIVTDHHQPQDNLPNANAVVNPHRIDDDSEFKEICGSTVALMFVRAINSDMNLKVSLKPYNLLAAIATIGDVMPLTHLNRILVISAINMNYLVNSGAPVGLVRLIQYLAKEKGKKDIDATFIAFYIVPLINATSRIGDVKLVMELLFETDIETVDGKIVEVIKLNEKRKEMSAEVSELYLQEAYQYEYLNKKYPIILSIKGVNKGLIGIVASKIAGIFNKPTVIFTELDGKFVGSARSVGNFDVVDLLLKSKEHTEALGGHPGAAGLTISGLNNFELFKESVINTMKEYKDKELDVIIPEKSIDVDLEIRLSDIYSMSNKLPNYAPYGEGNRELVFCTKNLIVEGMQLMGKKEGLIGAHLKLVLSDGQNTNQFLGFFKSEEFKNVIEIGDRISIAYKISGGTLMIEDILPYKFNVDNKDLKYNLFYIRDELTINDILANDPNFKRENIVPNVNEIKDLIVLLMRKEYGIRDISEFAIMVNKDLKANNSESSFNAFKLLRTMTIIRELFDGFKVVQFDLCTMYIPKLTGKPTKKLSASKEYTKIIQ